MPTPNSKQQECIDNIEGQYLVLAGPGTGKTFTIINRLKKMVELGIEAEKILCLTFTDAAAEEMKNRVDRELDKIDSNINIYTYHSFCNEIIKDNPDVFEVGENVKIISTAVARQFVREIITENLEENWLNIFRGEKNNPYYFIDEIIKGIKAIKQNRLTKEKYFSNIENNLEWKPELNSLKIQLEEKLLKPNPQVKTLVGKIAEIEKRIAKAQELWVFYEKYQQRMEKYHYIDFNDMISMVLDKFENDNAFLLNIANKYEYILVDEYQDTNKSQNDIVFNLVKGLNKKNIFVVGDDDQIIYSFQGAKLDTIEKFLLEFPETKVICLEENMRSTQSILDVARQIAKQDENRLENNEKFTSYNICKDLIAKNEAVIKKQKPVRFYKYFDLEQEYNEIVKEIDELIKSKDCPLDKDGNKNLSEIAILTKTNGELETFAQILKDRNIPYELKEGKNIFTVKSVIVMIYYMQMLTNPQLNSDKIFRILLNKPFSINPKDYEALTMIKSRKKSFIDAIKDVEKEEFVDYSKIEKFIKTYDYLREFIQSESLRNVVLEIGSKTGIFDYYLNSEINRSENIAGLKKLVDEAVEISSIRKTIGLEDFVEHLETCITDDIEIKTDKAPIAMNAIQLLTYYSSKGKEFEYVYMPTLFNTKWESKRTDKSMIPLDVSESKTEEEYKNLKIADCIRVMYVGMTRAKHTLRLSYYTNCGSRTKLTQFISNIQDMLEKEEKSFEGDENSYWLNVKDSLIKRDYDYKKDFNSLVDLKLKDKKYSPTYINTYLACPRQFLYSNILELLTVSAISDAASYGSAVHNAAQILVEGAMNKGFYISKEEFVEEFKKEMRKLPFSTYEQRMLNIEKGENALKNFYHHLSENNISSYFAVEKEVIVNIEGYDFKGKIDRIDKNQDGTYSIIDYKTGKAKGQKEIGIGKDYENYYNQIAFYKYMLEASEGVEVKETKFVFPDYPEETFYLNLTQKECEEVKDKYIKAIKDIESYKFEPCQNRDINSKPCKYCAFREFCDLEVL